MVTHQDIARAVGVSQATVSKVLSNKVNNIGISQKTRQSVIDAAIRLGYNKDKVASTLIQLVEKTIAVLVEHIATPFTSVIMGGIEQELAQSDYHYMYASSEGRAEVSTKMIEMLSRRYTTGFILMPFYESETSKYVHQFLKQRGIPFVQTNYTNLPGENDAPLIVSDNFDVAYRLTKHLIELGHERIAVFFSRPNHSSIAERLRGFEEAMQEAGLKVPKGFFVEMPHDRYYDVESKRQLLKQWQKSKIAPTAIMTHKDECAVQFIHLIESMGGKVPDDIAVTGFDDVPHFLPCYYHEIYQRLTTVRQNLPEIGRQAVRRLILDIEHPELVNEQPMKVVVPSEIIVRGSCGAKPPNGKQGTLEIQGLGSGLLLP